MDEIDIDMLEMIVGQYTLEQSGLVENEDDDRDN